MEKYSENLKSDFIMKLVSFYLKFMFPSLFQDIQSVKTYIADIVCAMQTRSSL